ILGAGLAALLLFFGLPQLAKALFGGEEHHRPGEKLTLAYPIDYQAEAGAAPAAKAEPDLGALLASANPEAGERRVALCKSCHNFDKGGPNQTGPNLWGVVGRPVGSHPGFAYTGALKAFGGDWTYERLDKFLADSQTLVPGTAMTQHWPKADQRADILAYLSTLSDNPVPFPKPAEPAKQADASAGGAGAASADNADAKPDESTPTADQGVAADGQNAQNSDAQAKPND
ncbi:MAG TPA: c-type cytochrome, partial [Parvularculaceae bacterium]|nr:c-type cytochrome [Parvularculaceae bacterium]